MNESLQGKTAIITGAGAGIGRATAVRFARAGANVLGVDLDATSLPETEKLAAGGAGSFRGLAADVTGASAPEDVMACCHDHFGPADILVNNAGIGAARPVHETDDEDLDRYLDVNLRSVFRLSRAALPDLRARSGAVVHVSSIFGLRGFPTSSIYSATKSALIGLTQNMAADYGPDGVRVNAIAPGVIATPLTAERLAGNAWFRDTLIGGTPLGRVGRPEEIAAAALFLCSDEASYVTGHVLVVDGGWSSTKFATLPS